jgi:hypothetical protein
MPTVDKETADKLIANDGYYPPDPRVFRIVRYENSFNGEHSYGAYHESEYVRNPMVYWSAS